MAVVYFIKTIIYLGILSKILVSINFPQWPARGYSKAAGDPGTRAPGFRKLRLDRKEIAVRVLAVARGRLDKAEDTAGRLNSGVSANFVPYSSTGSSIARSGDVNAGINLPFGGADKTMDTNRRR